MKTLLLIAMTASALMAQAQSDSMQDKLQEADAKIQAELDRKYTSKDGIEIRNVKKEELDRTIKKMGGNVTVEFGKEKERQIKVNKGGVHIGSGADPLMARDNTQASSSVVVPVPLQPKMSITLVGGKNKFCVHKVVRNEDGTLARGQTNFNHPEYSGGGCAVAGTPVRVKQPGTFLVEAGQSSMFVELNQDENKVIPLREIVIPVPSTENLSEIKFAIYPDLESSVDEREKIITKEFLNSDYTRCNPGASGDHELCTSYYRIDKLESYRKLVIFKSTPSGDFLGVKATAITNYTPATRAGIVAVLHFEDFSPNMGYLSTFHNSPSGPEAYKFYVLPGVYGIKWMIGDNMDVTKGIYVQ